MDEEPNLHQFKFLISEKSNHISKISVNQRGKISTAAPTGSLSSWHQDPKGCQLPISRSQVNQHDNCQPAAQSLLIQEIYTFMNQISLSLSLSLFTSLQKMYINESNLPLPTITKDEAPRNPSTASFSRFSI